MNNTNDFIAGLQQVIDFYRANPDLPTPNSGTSFNVFGVTKEQLQAFSKAAGKVSKDASESVFWLRKEFSGNIRLDFNAERDQVCKRVVVGTKLIPATPERIVPAQPEREEEIVEWNCTPVMAEKA